MMEIAKDSYFQRVEVFAKTETQRLRLSEVYPETLAYALVASGPNIVTKVLNLMEVDLDKLFRSLKESLSKKAKEHASKTPPDYNSIVLSRQTKEVMTGTRECCIAMGDPIIGSQHLLLALLKSDPKSKVVFSKYDVSFDKLMESLKEMVSLNKESGTVPPDFDESKKESVSAGHEAPSESSDPKAKRSPSRDADILTKFCRDLNALAARGKLDPVIGREHEMDRIIATLSRRKKNNPVLVGEPGTGKTSIIEGIAQRVASGTVPPFMKNKRIFALSLTSVVGKSQYRGQFEEKMRAIIQVFSANPDYVLFVDEVHTLLGAGSSIGGLDAANIMKPALSNGEIRCIGATTEEEYRKFFRKDGALERRFQKVMVEEPSKEDTITILEGLKQVIEKHQGCTISDDAITGAVDLTARYILDRRFPDKAIDCLDEACARLNVSATDPNAPKVITYGTVAEVVAEQAGIAKDVIKHTDTEKIMGLESFLKSKIVGQDEVILSVVRTLKNSYSGVRNPDRPISVLFLGGPSGTGKTFMAEKLAEGLFDSSQALIRINLSEFTEKHHQSRLIGSPPGYVGFGERNQLTDRLLRRPYSLILLDGVEHAHPEVLKLFMQAMSHGIMTDAEGRDISFRNAVIVLTMGTTQKGEGKAIGFNESKHSESDYEKNQNSLAAICKKKLGEEFSNRVDEFVPFSDLIQGDLEKVAKLMLDDMVERLGRNGIRLEYSNDVPKRVIEIKSGKHGSNAKPIERAISKNIETLISDELMKDPGRKCHIVLSVSKSKEHSLVAERVPAKKVSKDVRSEAK
jgi:ATP-dependent Clp protease ATP-binding subunit ClpC